MTTDLKPENVGVSLGGNKSSWMQTFTGKRFYPFDPKPEDICLEDIAQALSISTRFGGHIVDFYSVAQHSVLGYQVAASIYNSDIAKQFLLHDATEAYIGDLVRPVKVYAPWFKELEDTIWTVIATKYDIQEEFYPEVKHLDNVMCMWEKRDLHINSEAWPNMPDITDWNFPPIIPWSPAQSKFYFKNALSSIGIEDAKK